VPYRGANNGARWRETNPMTTTFRWSFSSLLLTVLATLTERAIEAFRDRTGVGGHNLPHFDGVVVLENETSDLRLMKVCKRSEMMLSSKMEMAR
jgi:hypothetical protein